MPFRSLRVLDPFRLLALDAFVDFLTMDGDIAWGIYADAHLIALYAEDGHRDLVANHQGLTHPSGQYQHRLRLPRFHNPQGVGLQGQWPPDGAAELTCLLAAQR